MVETREIEAGDQFGPYTIEGLVAGGGMGSVYAARHSIYGSTVALKILHPNLEADADWRDRFSKEGLVGTQLKHPHILSARDLIMEDDGRVALVLDLVAEGKTLLKAMSREFPEGLPLVQALHVLLGLIQGVEYAHDKSVVHGDIKPENVLIHGDFRDPNTWVPKLTDFGTVGIIALPVTVDGQPAVVVSPRYASPEHVMGMEHLEPRSDIYCLGLLLHYLLTGRHASNAPSVAEAARTVAHPVPITGIVDQPASIIRIFQRATAVDPEGRYPTCREFAVAVRDALEALGAELEVEDLQADLVTEIMEERRAAKRALLEKQQREQAERAETEELTPEQAQETAPDAPTDEAADDAAAGAGDETPAAGDEHPAGGDENPAEALDVPPEGDDDEQVTGGVAAPDEAAHADHPPTGAQVGKQEPDAEAPVDAEVDALEDEDTDDQVVPFRVRSHAKGADESVLPTEVPSEEREFLPDVETGTPGPRRREEAPTGGISTAIWTAIVIALAVIVAVLLMNLI